LTFNLEIQPAFSGYQTVPLHDLVQILAVLNPPGQLSNYSNLKTSI